MLMIGSRAASLRMPNFPRKCVDFDWICTKEEFDSWLNKNQEKVGATKIYELPEFNKWIVEGQTNCEFEIIKPGTSAELLDKLVKEDPETLETPFGLVPSISAIFAIKDSHKYKKFETPRGCANWYKHAIDWHMMRNAGAEIKPEYQEFVKLRSKETYTNKLPKLNVNKDEFFNGDGVNYVYDHDSIHRSVALFSQPAYTMYMKDGEQVMCDKDKFFSLPREVQLAGIIEESSVLAIERAMVPHGIWSAKYAWTFALSKVCSSITSGWFRKFGYDNLLEILNMYPENYWENFQKDVASGKVILFSGKKY